MDVIGDRKTDSTVLRHLIMTGAFGGRDDPSKF